MTFFIDLQIPSEDLYCINLCRLYLKAFFLSDIVDGTGKQILDEAWMGNPINVHRRCEVLASLSGSLIRSSGS
jgi:hypothetical protein